MDSARLLLDLTPLKTPGGARGIGRYIRELALGLSELPRSELEGIDLMGLTALGWRGEYAVTRDLASFEDPHRHAPPSGTDYYVWAYRQRLAFFLAARRLGATAVHLCDPHATPLFLKAFGIRKIVTCHDLVPTRYPERYMSAKDGGAFAGKLIEARRYRSADLVLAVSEATRRDVCTLLRVPAEKVLRVHNGADIERWAQLSAVDASVALHRHGLTHGRFVLYVGGSDWRKNVEGMFSAIGRARASGADLVLAWAGHLEPKHRERVEHEMRRTGVSGSVRLLGFVADEDLAVLYRASLAHLFVSRLEGFGLTVVEAMASGCPVVTTAGGSLAEVAGDAALTVDAEDHAAIAAALVRLAREPRLRFELVARGRERARSFSRRAQARGTAAAYRKVLFQTSS